MRKFFVKRDVQEMVVVIVGASSGIGRALAKLLASRGAKLVLIARRIELLEELNTELGGQHYVIRADVSKREDCERAIHRAFCCWGRIDTCVYCAGHGRMESFDKMTPDSIQSIIDTNFLGAVWCCRALIPLMKTQPERHGYTGQIILISSACARRGVPFMAPYTATKAAQLSFAEALGPELRTYNVAVTSVHPFTVRDTEFFSLIEKRSGCNPRAFVPGTMQTVEIVSETIYHSIERPRSEVWPKPFSRMALVCSIIFRSLTDWVLIHRNCVLFRRDNEFRTTEKFETAK